MQKLRSTTQVWCPHRPHHTPRASLGAITHWVFTISWPCCVSPHCRTVLFPTPEPAATARPPGNSLRLDSSKPFLVKSGCLWGLLTPQPPAGLLQPGCRRPAVQADTPIRRGRTFALLRRLQTATYSPQVRMCSITELQSRKTSLQPPTVTANS